MTENPTPRAKPAHVEMSQFSIHNNCLVVGGRPLTDIAQDMGTEPFYVYDSSVMTTQVEQLRKALPEKVQIHYAMKANPMPDVVRHLAGITDGLDVASAGELEVALATGTQPLDISFAGPGKSDADLDAAIAAGVIINMESAGEMHRIAERATEVDKRPPVAVRVNPDFELKTSGMKMSGGAKPFGVDAEKVPALLTDLAQLPLDFRGFHIFCGSQNLLPDAIIEAQNKTFALADRLATSAPGPVKWLNIGGGLGVPYFPGERRLDLDPVTRNLAQLIERYQQRMPEAEIVMELGRYLVAEAGLYVCTVIDRKESRGETFLITNGGLHHHLAASGNFGQVIRKNYPACIGNRVANPGGPETVSVVGPLCTPLDLLADKMPLSPADRGDLVVIFQSGAYGFSASPQRFLSHPAPREVMI